MPQSSGRSSLSFSTWLPPSSNAGGTEAGSSNPKNLPKAAMTEEELDLAERRRMKTVNFLSKLQSQGAVSEVRVFDNEQIYERCLFRCESQRPDRRGRSEPRCNAYCYFRIKSPPAGDEELITEGEEVSRYVNTYAKTQIEPEDSKYRFNILRNRYFYHASGRIALAKHAEGPPTVERIQQYEQGQARTPPKTTTRGERLGLIPRRAPLVPVVHYENLYPWCTGVSSRLQRFENHIVRIYGPAWRAIQQIPGLTQDGTQLRLAGQIYDCAVSGDGLVLGQKLAQQGSELMRKWLGGSGSGSEPSAGISEGSDGNQNGVPPPPRPPSIGPTAPPVPPDA